MSQDDILVVGGYGVVGRRIAALLATRFRDRVVVAGRDASRARQASAELSHGARARHIDVDDRESVKSALAGVGTVMACVAQRKLHLLSAAIENGLAYTDLAPGLALRGGIENIDGQAKRTGARVVLGAGLSPGVSNMMARKMADRVGQVDRIETSIALSLGDEYGPDSLRHVFESLTRRFEVMRDGSLRCTVPYSEGRLVQFPPPIGSRRAYLFPWSDVVNYPSTLGAHTSIGRFALEPVGLSYLLSSLMRLGAVRWLEHPTLTRARAAAVSRLKRLGSRSDGFALWDPETLAGRDPETLAG